MVFGIKIRKRLLWALMLIPVAALLFSSTAATKLAVFLTLLVFNAFFTFFHYRLHIPVDITPLTLSLLITGYFYGPLGVIALYLLGSLAPGIFAGSGLGPASFIYIPLNILLGIIFPMFATQSLVFSLFIFLLLYAFLVFLIDGFFFSSFVRSLAMSAAFLITNLIYLGVVWRLQTLFKFA
ncbi:MAG: hypothetical protein AABX51_08485, partial [Nanoarchaeota archaeon]